jgi:hypothetical protein
MSLWSIDYRSVDAQKIAELGVTSWYQCVADDARIPKTPVIVLSEFTGLSILNPNISEIAVLVEILGNEEIVEIISASNG